MSDRSYESARYHVAFAYGLGHPGEGADSDAVVVFEDYLQSVLNRLRSLELVQRGIGYFEGGQVKTLRQQKRTNARNLTSYEALTSTAEQASFYVFDVLSATTPPLILANLHWTNCSRFGTITLLPVGDRPIGRFAAFAVERSQLTDELESIFESELPAFFAKFLGVIGGVLLDRPYVWNGRAGIEWMFREVAQSAPGGDLLRLRLPCDSVLSNEALVRSN